MVLLPDFSIPEAGWENRRESVTIVTPAGQATECMARIEVAHFQMSELESTIDQRWRVAVVLEAADKPPAGSRVLVTRELCAKLRGA